MNAASPIEQLRGVMERLRGPGGCPWDREQTLTSLKSYLVEECYEVLDAVDSGDPAKHAEELGDLLMHIVLHAQIRGEQGQFTLDDVARGACEKLIRRHPHVFAGRKVSGSAEVLKNWDAIKAREREKPGPQDTSALAGVPRHLPALQRAHQVQGRAARVGFDWSRAADVVAKIEEELGEVRQAMAAGDPIQIREEIGDLLFAVVNLSRFQQMNAEELLAATVDKFIRRFQAVEARIQAEGRCLANCTPAELDEAWNAVKELEAKHGGQKEQHL